MNGRGVFISIVFLLMGAGLCFGFDFGLTVDNATGVRSVGEVEFTQRDKAALWFKGIFGGFSVDVQGSYTFSLDRYLFFDLDLLRFGGEFLLGGESSFVFRFGAGRFLFRDFSGKVLSHKLDGVKAELGLPFGVITVSGGYAGLTQKPVSGIIISSSDLADRVDDAVIFGPSRVVEMVELLLPEVFLRQDIKAALLFQQDLRADAKLTSGGGKVHTEYAGLGLSGPVVHPLYWNGYFYFNLGQSSVEGTILSFLTGGGVDLYLPRVLGSRFWGSFVYAGGDGDAGSVYEGSTAGN
ncbi:MAG: hypothetical protein DRP87_18445, partial [Spirochaetes bacterium]